MPRGCFLALPTPRRETQTCDFTDRTDRAGLDQLDHPPVVFASVDLNPHLRRHAGLGSRQADLPRLPNVVRQRFFTVDVLLVLAGPSSWPGAWVCSQVLTTTASKSCGRSNRLRKSTSLRALGNGWAAAASDGSWTSHSAHDVFAGNSAGVASASASSTDDGDIQLAVQVAGAQQGRHGKASGGAGGYGAGELAASQLGMGTASHDGSPSGKGQV
jgi:hypothetical protein